MNLIKHQNVMKKVFPKYKRDHILKAKWKAFWNLCHMFCMFKGVEKFLNCQWWWRALSWFSIPLHLLLLKVALAGLLSVQHWADGRIGFCWALRRRVSLCFIIPAKCKRFGDGTRQPRWCCSIGENKDQGFEPSCVDWTSDAKPKSGAPSADAKDHFFWIYLSFGISAPRAAWWCYGE